MSLKVSDLTAGYRKGINIIEGVSVETKRGFITCIIGPNGAGKSTLLRTIFGFLKPVTGKITFNGEEITDLSPAAIRKKGISYVPQERTLFPQLTVEANLELGGWTLRKNQEKLQNGIKTVYSMFPNLRMKSKEKTAFLSGGEMRMLEIAKGLITDPELMIIDEPTSGLAPKLMVKVYEKIKESQREGTTILLVDQNIKKGVETSDYVYMLSGGKITFEADREVFKERLEDLIRQSLIGR